jgi:hypothetical protein
VVNLERFTAQLRLQGRGTKDHESHDHAQHPSDGKTTNGERAARYRGTGFSEK